MSLGVKLGQSTMKPFGVATDGDQARFVSELLLAKSCSAISPTELTSETLEKSRQNEKKNGALDIIFSKAPKKLGRDVERSEKEFAPEILQCRLPSAALSIYDKACTIVGASSGKHTRV